jgi:Mrp family chromosome partitioning ATPase
LFTGAASGEGKSTVSANLAQTLARSGLRVALIDADPHGSGLHKSFDQPEEPGILDHLRGEVDARAIIHPTATPGLSFISRGAFHNETEGLFLRPELGRLLQTLGQEQDYVILDGPPILSADDAALLVPHADAVIVVVRPSYTRSGQLRHVLDMLYQRKAKEVLMVFNQARAEDLAGRYARNGHSHGRKNGKPPAAVKPPSLTPQSGPK